MAQQAGGGIERPAPEDRPGRRAPAAGPTLSDRELLEQIHAGLRRLEPLLEAAERHPLVRAFLRRT